MENPRREDQDDVIIAPENIALIIITWDEWKLKIRKNALAFKNRYFGPEKRSVPGGDDYDELFYNPGYVAWSYLMLYDETAGTEPISLERMKDEYFKSMSGGPPPYMRHHIERYNKRRLDLPNLILTYMAYHGKYENMEIADQERVRFGIRELVYRAIKGDGAIAIADIRDVFKDSTFHVHSPVLSCWRDNIPILTKFEVVNGKRIKISRDGLWDYHYDKSKRDKDLDFKKKLEELNDVIRRAHTKYVETKDLGAAYRELFRDEEGKMNYVWRKNYLKARPFARELLKAKALDIKFRGRYEVSELADDWYLKITRWIFRLKIRLKISWGHQLYKRCEVRSLNEVFVLEGS